MPVSTPDRPGRSSRASRPSAGARSRAATRGRLLESAQSLFAERGLHGVTTHDIAHAAGVAAGTFYLHFKDKRDIFREIARATVAQMREFVGKAGASAPDAAEAVAAHADALLDFAETNRDVVRILFSADADADAIESDVLAWLAAGIEENRRERAAEGDLDDDLDPVVLSQAIVGMWARVIAWWLEDPARAPRERVVRTLTHIQLSGTGPPGVPRP